MNSAYFSNEPSNNFVLSMQIQRLENYLQEFGNRVLPRDYIAHLYENNNQGKNIGQITLFGIEPMLLAQGEEYPGILGATIEADDDIIIDTNSVVIGRMTGDMLLTFSSKDNLYHIIDPGDASSTFEHHTLEELVDKWSQEEEYDKTSTPNDADEQGLPPLSEGEYDQTFEP